MPLINSYTGSCRRCSTQKTACTLPCKEMQVQFQWLAGHGQWSWQQRFGAWESSLLNSSKTTGTTTCKVGTQKSINNSGPFKNLNKMWQKTIWEASFSPPRLWCWKCLRGYISEIADLPSCCRAPSLGTWTSCDLYWRFPTDLEVPKK